MAGFDPTPEGMEARDSENSSDTLADYETCL